MNLEDNITDTSKIRCIKLKLLHLLRKGKQIVGFEDLGPEPNDFCLNV